MSGRVVGFARVKLPTESRQAPSESEETPVFAEVEETPVPAVLEEKPVRKPRARRKPVAVPTEDDEGVVSEPGE